MSDRRPRRSEIVVSATIGPTGLSMMGLALVVLLLSACAGGSPPGEREPGDRDVDRARGGWQAAPIALLLVEVDADGDRVVTRRELEQALPRLFEGADSDGSGGITPIEYRDWAVAVFGTEDAPPGRMAFDLNGDGRIDPGEFRGTLSAIFVATDKDHDGRIVRADLVELVRVQQTTGGPGGKPVGGGGRPQRR